jgi:hypothetical protein
MALSLLALSIGAQASKVATLNSGYGFGNFGTDDETPTSTCITLEDISCFLTEQTFYATDSSSTAVYDFKINDDISNFTLQLLGNATAMNYGWFIQDPAFPDDPVQYGPDPTDFITSSGFVDNGMGAQITVSGDGKGYVFYLVLNQPEAMDPPPDPGNVTASIVPEPRLFPILGIALLVLVLVRGRYRARAI